MLLGWTKMKMSKMQIADWLMLSRGTDNKITIDLNPDKIKNFLDEKVAPQIEINPVNARFQIKDNRVVLNSDNSIANQRQFGAKTLVGKCS